MKLTDKQWKLFDELTDEQKKAFDVYFEEISDDFDDAYDTVSKFNYDFYKDAYDMIDVAREVVSDLVERGKLTKQIVDEYFDFTALADDLSIEVITATDKDGIYLFK